MRATLARLSMSLVLSCAAPRALTPDFARVGDARAWTLLNAEHRVAIEEGKTVLHLAPVGGDRPGSNVAFALFAGDLAEATFEVDLRAEGDEGKSFLGVAFGVVDASHYEALYFRPFNFRAEDPARRSHAVQYVAWPDHTWEALRKEAPGVYEADISPAPAPAAWFHARVEVTARAVRVFVDAAREPCLVVQRLSGRAGRVGLFVDSREGAFANLTIREPRGREASTR